MQITFLGTRGEIDLRSRAHRLHSALLVRSDSTRVMVDCGEDWERRLARVAPDAIVLTHAHPDHAAGLRRGAPCPVYASRETLRSVAHYRLSETHPLAPRSRTRICGISFEAYPVVHSLRAPAYGFRITAGRTSIFYVPDVAEIPERREALHGIALYVGDGASVRRGILRRRSGTLIGHASIETQLAWCRAEGVRRAIFTHCGSAIVRANASELDDALHRLAQVYGVCAGFARDGLTMDVSSRAEAGRTHAHADVRD
jgi:phosphoribosyl 1,2-cyclic phosphodiesterase